MDKDRVNENISVDTKENTLWSVLKCSSVSTNHKSYCGDVDMEMLDACRTVVPDESWKMMKLELMRGVAKTNAVSHAGNEILKIKKKSLKNLVFGGLRN